jgi:hypothetical protein
MHFLYKYFVFSEICTKKEVCEPASNSSAKVVELTRHPLLGKAQRTINNRELIKNVSFKRPLYLFLFSSELNKKRFRSNVIIYLFKAVVSSFLLQVL